MDAAEAEAIRMIFELAERGETRSGVARILDAKGRGRRNGKPMNVQNPAVLERVAG